ncbi:hypothetical protein HCU64_20690 [Methylobacterium sp. C25]|uniref:hypothetical protein n=1 Tax=Methylobacterium sp. C25 TaxID=2721622 RepID=UPI001F30E086|nr:hypothetical protein [Methylobacterium sp. C25]MCE4226174.1 hypothetical protein [Methylobacterium sp. C25]
MKRRVGVLAVIAGAVSTAILAFPKSAAAQTDASPYGFSVRVSLSPKALQKLTAMSESVNVKSFYYGKSAKKPTRADIKRAREEGREPDQIEIVGDVVTLPAAGGLAEIPGRNLDAAEIAAVGRNLLKVNLNVFSARKAVQDNLLDCDLFDDDLELARAKPIAIGCRLIGEQ